MKNYIRSVRTFALSASTCAVLAAGYVALAEDDGFTGTNTAVTEGPDITVWRITGDSDYAPVGTTRAYSVGTDSCNIGSEPALWCNPDHPAGNDDCVPAMESTDHPVIATNLYRLKNGRFEQIGKSFLKHGFNSVNTTRTACRGNGGGGTLVGCQDTASGPTLNVGCTDFYGSSTNGDQPLAPRSEMLSAANGTFPPTYTQPTGPGANSIDSRLQVDESEIDPDANPGADVLSSGVDYWIEVHYLSPDDAQAGNGLNNASYVEATFSDDCLVDEEPCPEGEETTKFILDVDAAPTVREAAAVWAWKAADSQVEIQRVDLDTAPVERFHIARRVTESSRGVEPWHYEVVVHNLNSDRAARALEIKFPNGTTFSGAGFHDIDPHSGEAYDDEDWLITTNSTTGTVRWEMQDGHLAPSEQVNANAIRWGTAYTFWFDASSAPTASSWSLDLFAPQAGDPDSVTIPFGRFFEDGFESADTSKWSATVP